MKEKSLFSLTVAVMLTNAHRYDGSLAQ